MKKMSPLRSSVSLIVNEPLQRMKTIIVIDAIFTGVKRNVNDVLSVRTSYFHTVSGHTDIAVKNKFS